MLSVSQQQEYEDYRKASRERYAAQQLSTENPAALAPISEDAVMCPSPQSPTAAAAPNPLSLPLPLPLHEEICESPAAAVCDSPVPTACASPVPTGSDSPALNRSLDSVKKPKRRSSFSKVFSSLSGVFSKKPDSPEITREKARLKAEKDKKEQDHRMAHLIAQLEFEGRNDAEIQMHLFQLRDQAHFASPRMNGVGDLFRSVHQAFKEEFSTRRLSGTVQPSEMNPFYVAASANYMNDLGFTYEDLVALENVPRGVKSLDHLPVTTYQGQELPSLQTTCAVCMQEFEHDEELRSLHCTHHFHKECIDKWLAVGTNCPVCKCEVESECL